MMPDESKVLPLKKVDKAQEEYLTYLTILRDRSLYALSVYMQSQNMIDESVIRFQKHMVESYEDQLQNFIKTLKDEKE